MVSIIRQVIFVFIAGLALAQTSTSRITGTVSDATGALVPGAMVTAKNEATGVTYTQATTEAGLYAFPSLPVGSYTITVGAPPTTQTIVQTGEAGRVIQFALKWRSWRSQKRAQSAAVRFDFSLKAARTPAA